MSETVPKLLFVRVYLGDHRMDVALFDPVLGDHRIIQYKWHAKDTSNAPPAKWYEAVLGEVKFQRALEWKKRTGRYIPRR